MTTLTETHSANEPPQVDAVCAVLDDAYARELLDAIGTDGKTVRELTARCSASRATIYRRLDRLERAGLVRTEMVYDPDGYHRRLYRARLAAVTVSLEADGLTVDVSLDDAEKSERDEIPSPVTGGGCR